MNGKQIIVVAIVVVISGYLYFQPVKGLTKQKTAKQTSGAAAGTNRAASKVTVEQVSIPAKSAIGAALAATINDLESQLKNASSAADKLEIEKKLAKQWDDDNQPAPSAFYYLAAARADNSYDDWMKAGNHFNDAFKQAQDTTAQPVYDANAVEAFQKATTLAADNLDAQAGLGIAYVNGGGPPMQGIGLLLGVVAKDPNNRNAVLNLGLFAMKSGQFDKAVDRFKSLIVIEQKNKLLKTDVEPYFYLAESYKQLGMKKEAIDTYEKCKEMMPDPTFDQKIDEYIKELKN